MVYILYSEKSYLIKMLPKLWTQIPYPGDKAPPSNPVEPSAGHWPIFYLARNQAGFFTDLQGNAVHLKIRSPRTVDFCKQLKIVHDTLKSLTPRKIKVAKYWGSRSNLTPSDKPGENIKELGLPE